MDSTYKLFSVDSGRIQGGRIRNVAEGEAIVFRDVYPSLAPGPRRWGLRSEVRVTNPGARMAVAGQEEGQSI